jgi:AcrR family transcriptional regulator
MTASIQSTQPGRENRQQAVLDAAAALYREKGYEGTSMRAIARACGMLPGSLYFHFPSKEDIFLAVQQQGIRHIIEAVTRATEGLNDPWDRLTAACEAHLNAVLDESDCAAVLIRAAPRENPAIFEKLRVLRDEYEDFFRMLVDDLHLPRGTSRKYLRLALLGALNWSQTWYRPGRDDPGRVARELIHVFRNDLDEE